MSQIADNIRTIQKRIQDAADSCGRKAEEIHLVAVSKKQAPEKILSALEAGHRIFGENRVQEAQEHWQDLKKDYPDLQLHLIGPLQTNKVKDAVALFDVIETIDRAKLVDAVVKEMEKQGRDIKCFVQVNTGEEDQKAGVLPDDLPALLEHCREKTLQIQGLMCIPPYDEPPALHFALLQKLAARHDLAQLSMGMSADFEKAIALGATYIRVGTAVFGAREE